MSPRNSKFHAICERGGIRALAGYLIRQIRRPLVAYIMVMTIVGVAFGLTSYQRDQDLQHADFVNCQVRLAIIVESNKNIEAIHDILGDLSKGHPSIEKKVEGLQPIPLPECQHLRP